MHYVSIQRNTKHPLIFCINTTLSSSAVATGRRHKHYVKCSFAFKLPSPAKHPCPTRIGPYPYYVLAFIKNDFQFIISLCLTTFFLKRDSFLDFRKYFDDFRKLLEIFRRHPKIAKGTQKTSEGCRSKASKTFERL